MFTCLVVVLATLVIATSAVAAGPTTAPAGWRLVWADEFDYTGLPDPTKWGYEVGFVRNNELQYYTDGRRENVRVADGSLIIEGRKESFPNPDHRLGSTDPKHRATLDYTAGSISTEGKASWTYGRVEVRAKLPQGKGVWPAIWMLGTNIRQIQWPRCGEIDVMEFVGHTPRTVHGTVHYHVEQKQQKGEKLVVEEPLTGFHVYAAEWHADRIDFFFKDRKYFTFDVAQADQPTGGPNPFRQPFYLLLNLALGGSWGGAMDDSVLPQRFEVDYVRIYEAAR